MDSHSLERLDFLRVRELLAGFAMTALGRGLAGSIRPTARLDLVQRWLLQVRELARLHESRGLPPLAGVSDIRDSVRRCAPPLHVSVEEVAAIGATLAATHELAKYLADLPEGMAELRHMAERIGDFRTIAERIHGVIDERGHVRDNASPKLARIRRDIGLAQADVGHAVDKLLQDAGIRRILQFPNHTFFNDRLVLPLKTEYRGRLPGIIHRHSDSGATIYVEPAQAVELNNRIANLHAEQAEEIARLLWELAHEIYINSEAILATVDSIAVLDLIVAKLRLAREYDMTCPEVVDAAMVNVRDARHPLLLELMKRRRQAGEITPNVVPINYRLGDDFDLLVITGPNTGGKTVTLKTIGLLTLMVQAGMPAPVGEGSVFGLFREVLIDVGDEQSLQQSLSTFSAHLTRQLEMLRRAAPHTLLLLDELGSGTDPDEGAAIGRAILQELLRHGCRAIATTHLGALKSFPLQRPRAENACVEFDPVTLEPTYRLIIGQPGMSNAIDIAQRLGMPKRLVVAARMNLSRRARAFHAAMGETLAVKKQAEEARDAAQSARMEAERRHGEAEAARQQLEKQQSEFNAWAQRVAHLRPGDPVRVRDFDRDGRVVRIRLDQQRAEIDVGAFAVEVPLGDIYPPQAPPPPPRPPRPVRPPEPSQRPQKPRSEQGRPPQRSPQAGHPGQGRPGPQERPRDPQPRPELPSLTEQQALALQPGETVVVKRFHRDGRVVRVKPTKKVVVVSAGLLEVEVPFDGLALKPAPRQRERPKPPRPAPRAPPPPPADSNGETSAPAAELPVDIAAAASPVTEPSAETEPRP